MLTEDYLMRYIRIATAALARLAGLKAAGLDSDALFMLDRTLEQMLGLRIDLIRSLNTRDLFKLLADQERLDPALLAVLGDLFAGEADLLSRLERPVDSLGSAINALGLYLEAELSGLPPEGSVRGKIEAMLTWVKPEEIPDETWFSLFSYGEQSGDLCTAYDALERLIAHTGLQPDLVNVAREFYQGLLIRPSKELETAGITLTEIQSALQRVESAR